MSGMKLVDPNGDRVPDEDVYGRRGMRDRQNHWWQDLGMQDAGWSYEFFDPTLLLRHDVRFADGVVQPDGPGYQALIVYQEALDPAAASRLLEWAGAGLRVLIVNGTRELKLLLADQYTEHRAAASRTPGLDGRDGELAETMAALRRLPTVAEISDPAQTLDALRRLGVVGRAEFVEPNRNVLGYLREDGDLLHLYLYHFLYETGSPTTVEVALPGLGDVQRIDPWTGRLAAHRGVRTDNGRTVLSASLFPGETALFTIDRSASPASFPPAVSEEIQALTEWTVAVESWDAGEPEILVEDRGLGYTTREVRPTTAMTRLEVGSTGLLPWSELAGVGPEVSGVGEYRTSFTLAAAPGGDQHLVLDLGSTGGGLGAVVVNDGPARGFDTSHPVVDITDVVKAGHNEVVVRVASSLNNRLIARGYYDQVPDIARFFSGRREPHTTRVRDYGLLGPVRLLMVR